MHSLFLWLNNSMTDKIHYTGMEGIEFRLYSYLDNQKKYDFPMIEDSRLDNLDFRFVPFNKLKITQKQKDSFSISHLMDILKNFHPALLRPSGVIKYKNDYILWDGHHSATVALCIGMDVVPCVVYECNTIEEINLILEKTTIENIDLEQVLDMIEFTDDLKEEVIKRYGR